MVIRVGLLVVTRFVLDFPIAGYGRIALACRGIVPATVATVVAVVRVVPTFFNVVTRLVRRFRVFFYYACTHRSNARILLLARDRVKILVVSHRRCLAVTARILFRND